MLALKGLAWLLLFQSAGEVLARVAHLPLPGPVIGLILLVPVLGLASIRAAVAATAEVLLANLSLLFVPVGVGVMTHLDLISAYGVRLLVVIVVSTWIGIGMTAWTLSRLLGGRS